MCANVVRLLLAFVERVLSSLLIDCGKGGGGTIAMSTLMHLAGAGRFNLVNYFTYLHRFARVAALPAHPVDRDDHISNGRGPERIGGGPGHCPTCNMRCWCACSGDGVQGGPGQVCLGG